MTRIEADSTIKIYRRRNRQRVCVIEYRVEAICKHKQQSISI